MKRGKSKATREAFRAKYRSPGRCLRRGAAEQEAENEAAHKNAFGKCVSAKAKAHKDEMDDEDEEQAPEFKNAAEQCAAERGDKGAE